MPRKFSLSRKSTNARKLAAARLVESDVQRSQRKQSSRERSAWYRLRLREASRRLFLPVACCDGQEVEELMWNREYTDNWLLQNGGSLSDAQISENETTIPSSVNNPYNYEIMHYTESALSTAIAAQIVSALKPMIRRLINEVQLLRTEVEKLKGSKNALDQVAIAVEPLFSGLTNEVRNLRSELQTVKSEDKQTELEKNDNRIQIMHKEPFLEMDEFLKFEALLQENEDFFMAFEKELHTVAQAPNFIRNCWSRVFKDELAHNFCWKGTEEKSSIRNSTTAKAIRYAAISKGLSEEEYIKQTIKFFSYASGRKYSRKAYQERIKKIESNRNE